ncbi:calmodulin-domain kinase (macronuclear) [Tetrahymena thermophila SB210]|uniref:Calcium-dependent protein kinase 1 n=1 Tax=Tetrahymena thermophila (strain SB210) TaxID=312017 RepID=Q22CV2_TETTS|nr:calmodulin-domain kinase [Tetrahymena thermophila SB210]EAR83086.2 calmodulin-domain kinase [Tetrahymena thermophila SB210]|eukprot:XP_001030749.2 calmodulin-domain kinase [Tetrahymena thermophila SB210]
MGCTTSKSSKSNSNGEKGQSNQNPSAAKYQDNKIETSEIKSTLPFKINILRTGNISSEYKFANVILGEGAFGVVRLVEQRQTGLRRAMKSIKKSNIIKEEEEKMFAEVNILSTLTHPNIIQLFELYQDEQNYYLITEYCSGGELFEKIRQMEQFSEREAADYMKQILSAIVYCHSLGIVHRDLKPENLLFDSNKPNANLKVIDFGTSRRFDSSKKMTKRLGTPYYIAPEVLQRSYDQKCDVWSCGVILYILLCGYPPFNGRTEEQILKSVAEDDFTFEDTEWSCISKEAKDLISRMLKKNPEERITAQQAYDDVWVQKNASKNPLNTKVLTNLGSFHSKNKLRASILTFIATHIVSQQEKEELLKTFKGLDQNGDGLLEKHELVEGYLQVMKDRAQAEEFVNKIFDEIDVNSSGKVDCTEFVVAAMQREKLLSKNKIEKAFKMFDTDGNGFIDRHELQNILGGGSNIDDATWNSILVECDQNGDGKISQNEFIDLLVKKIDNGGTVQLGF